MARGGRGRAHASPIRRALRDQSSLQGEVRDGLAAMTNRHRRLLDDSVRTEFADTLDLDRAMTARHPQENRWDYLLGHSTSDKVVGLEPHSAKSDQVTTVIAKKEAAMRHLRPHLRAGQKVAAWYWVASGNVYFADTEREARRLDQKGIKFVGRRVRKKDLL